MNSTLEQATLIFNAAGLELEVLKGSKGAFRILLDGMETNTYMGLHLLENLSWIAGEIRMIWYMKGQADGIKYQQQQVFNALGLRVSQ